MGKYNHIQHTTSRICPICGNSFTCQQKSPKKFCSPECQWEWQKQQVGVLNSRYTGKECICTYCGKKFFIQDYKLKTQTHWFCCIECRRKWYAEIWSQTQEWKEKSKRRTELS